MEINPYFGFQGADNILLNHFGNPKNDNFKKEGNDYVLSQMRH